MTREQFAYRVKPLIKRFGENVFGEDTISLLHSKLILLTDEQVDELVEDCLLEFNFAPSLAKIIILAKPKLDQAYDLVKKEKMAYALKHPCYLCDNSGWVEAVDTTCTMRYVSGFRCSCVVGKDFVGPKETVFWSEQKFGDRFLAGHKTKHSMGGGTRTEHIEQSDKIHFKRLADAMGIEASVHDQKSLEQAKNSFMAMSVSDRIKVLEKILTN